MRLAEKGEVREDPFTEGEPDLEPPEELALAELDDETLLEEELDNEDIAEEDVDEVTLELTLEDLVHQSDSEDQSDDGQVIAVILAPELEKSLLAPRLPNGSASVSGDRAAGAALRVAGDVDTEDLDDLEVADLEDVEESLDRILAERLAGDGDASDELDGEDEEEVNRGSAALDGSRYGHPAAALVLHRVRTDGAGVSPCRDDEFVCVACFLVKNRAQLADSAHSLCRDCSY